MKLNHKVYNGLLLIIIIFINSCRQPTVENKSENKPLERIYKVDTLAQQKTDSIAKVRQDSISKIEEKAEKKKYEKAIALAEKDFYTSIKAVDKDYGENNYTKLKAILKKHKTTPYELYTELTSLFKKAKESATDKATSSGLRERMYTDFINKIEDKYIADFQSKYNMDRRLYLCFKNNYCSCVGDNSDSYCAENQSLLPNGEYWK